MPRLKRSASKRSKKARVREEMHKFKYGNLRSSSGKKVTKRSQAVAIAMSESGQSKKDRKKRAVKR